MSPGCWLDFGLFQPQWELGRVRQGFHLRGAQEGPQLGPQSAADPATNEEAKLRNRTRSLN